MEDKTKIENSHQIEDESETQVQAEIPVKKVDNSRHWLGIAAVFISLATLFVGAVQAWIYNQQRKMQVEQLDITKKSERAYVGVESLDADFENRSVMVLLQNVGQIPASAINVQLIEIRQTSEGSPGSLKPHAFTAQQIFGTLKMRISLKLDEFQPGEIENIMTKKETEGIRITIQYHDGFDRANPTKLTYQFVGPASNNWIVLPE